MRRYHFFILLAVLFGITSCNMSRWYFRHGGNTSKNFNSTDQTTVISHQENNSFSTTPEDSVINEPIKNQTVSLSESAVDSHSLHKPVKISSNSTVDQTKKNSTISPLNSSSYRHPASDQIGFGMLMIVLLFILLCGVGIFLIAWIFAPVVIAFRIAFWITVSLLSIVIIGTVLSALFSN